MPSVPHEVRRILVHHAPFGYRSHDIYAIAPAVTQTIDSTQAALLGLLQGLTEFLPVSSSGHVAIGSALLGLNEQPLAFVVLLHVGTLIATIAMFRDDLRTIFGELRGDLANPRRVLQTPSGQLALSILVATLATIVIALLLESRVEHFGHDLRIVGAFLLVSAVAVIATRMARGQADAPTLLQALVIGLAQGLAVMPGLSRSGSTIAVAMLLGMNGKAAFRFSFLLSLPIVAGAALRELRDPQVLTELGLPTFVGGTVAMISGYFALKFLRRVLLLGHFWAFAIYLIPLGFGLLFWGVGG